MYPNVELFIGGKWQKAAAGKTLPIYDPATEDQIGTLAHAEPADLDAALEAARRGFIVWRAVSAFDRSRILRRAGAILRERADVIAPIMTQEQGKVLAEAQLEVLSSADIFDWFAEEARRAYGRVIPSRSEGVSQWVEKEPVGPVAAFTPWNFPIAQAARKVAAALAAGCSVILKGPEETPASCAEMVRAVHDAGVPPGVLNLVFGTPAQISEYLIPHPIIRKISFTGSTVVGKRLAALAGMHMKRVTMELGGHAPAIVFKDADIDRASLLLAKAKYRNAGQVCIAPTRFLVQEPVYDAFVEKFAAHASAFHVGNGLDPASTMGPLANPRRIDAMETLIADAKQNGATLRTGGERIGNKGNFFQPTVLDNVSKSARAMNEEPFGPLALFSRFREIDEVVEEANRLPYGLASYVYTGSEGTARKLSSAIEAGMVSVNHHGLALPELPFGGVKDSGYGSEGGSEAIEAYLAFKFVTHQSV